MAMQALRNKVGAATHDKILRAWARQHRHGNASLAQFEALAQSRTSKDLTAFFDEWLHQTNRPLPSKALGFPASMLGRTAPASPLPDGLAERLRAAGPRG
jgi:predicted metalloprotease with PDZ domain